MISDLCRKQQHIDGFSSSIQAIHLVRFILSLIIRTLVMNPNEMDIFF